MTQRNINKIISTYSEFLENLHTKFNLEDEAEDTVYNTLVEYIEDELEHWEIELERFNITHD